MTVPSPAVERTNLNVSPELRFASPRPSGPTEYVPVKGVEGETPAPPLKSSIPFERFPAPSARNEPAAIKKPFPSAPLNKNAYWPAKFAFENVTDTVVAPCTEPTRAVIAAARPALLPVMKPVVVTDTTAAFDEPQTEERVTSARVPSLKLAVAAS